MSPATISFARSDSGAILDRHNVRRTAGVPTVSVLVGPVGVSTRKWRRWAAATERSVVVAESNSFPSGEWIRSVVEQTDLRAAAVGSLALRAGRDPEEFSIEWQAKSHADRERYFRVVSSTPDDDQLHILANLVPDGAPRSTALALTELGDPIIPLIVRMVRAASCPCVLFTAASTNEFVTTANVAAQWAVRVPQVPIAVAVPCTAWDEYVSTTSESRVKALLKEGEHLVEVIDPGIVERSLNEAGAAPGLSAVIAVGGADSTLIESAIAAVQAWNIRPSTQPNVEDRARSAAEQFLFDFLESLDETVGRFELNGLLDFRFGPRRAEVDLLCRSPRIAIELDGYYHFHEPEAYRRDREKDWELQRRGFTVLRFLSDDVIQHLDVIRDRILDALNVTPTGEFP